MKRTLKYKHPKINYNKLKTNKAYYHSVINKLKFYYLYKEYRIKTATLFLYKRQRNQIHTYIKYFNNINFTYSTNKEACNYVLHILNKGHKCKECNKNIETKPYNIFCSNRCSNNYKIKDPKYISNLSNALKNFHNNISKKEKKIRNKNISKGNKRFYKNMSNEEYQNYCTKFKKKAKNTYLKNYGYEWCSQVPEIKERSQQNREKTNIIKYGGIAPMCSKYIKNKTRNTNINNGLWLRLEDMKDYEHYRYLVREFTERQTINLLFNYNKRGNSGTKDAYQLDHKYSIKQGFVDNIAPFIIGSIHNLEMIPWKENISKGSKCSISKEELLDNFYPKN